MSEFDYNESVAKLTAAHQAQAMSDLEADRCLLRRDTKASQNKTYGLPNDTLPECSEEDMGVQIGDNDNSIVHNHYHREANQPRPCPPPPSRIPWWLMALVVIPWIVLAALLIGWLLAGSNNNPIIWRLDGESLPPAQPEPTAGEIDETSTISLDAKRLGWRGLTASTDLRCGDTGRVWRS